MYLIEIDEKKCTNCGECVNICPNEVYKLQDGKVIVANAGECSNCQSCVSVCEPQAITVSEV
ncbi:MAG: 4Fe-4S binding protein [Planctomycetes bacterium]|jgi:NAD-dependent dihydropyrimidine dehydrogenase PreA subunit|nr:4Fe-4S binding protein [Planctomycetota bacterium]MDA8376852.1 4Fe-4S binding protein [Planctomycetia bacterium]